MGTLDAGARSDKAPMTSEDDVSRRRGESALFYPELLDLGLERRSRNTELRSRSARPGHFAFALRQRSFDHLFLLSLQRCRERARPLAAKRGPTRQPCFVDRERVAGTQDDRSLDDVLELANVAGPGVSLTQLQR